MPPIAVAFGILILVAVAGIVITMVRGKSTYSGYESIAGEVRAIAKTLANAETFRDGNDVVVSGNYHRLPTIIRFSYDENTPGVNIHMKAPATFTMSIVPKGARATEGRVLVRTPDDMFDARFTTRSDNPTQAKMFTSGRATMQALQKVCCSSKTFFTVTPGAIELSELVIPEPYTAQHLNDHIGMMGKLAQQLGEMPGSESVKIRAMEHEKSSWLLKGAVAAGILAAVIVVVAATQDYGKEPHLDSGRNPDAPMGMVGADIPLIANLKGWRLATDADFSPAAAGWLRGNGQQASGRISGDFTGQGPVDAAYLLVNDETGKRRIVMVGHNALRFDSLFDQIGVIGLLPADKVSSTEWALSPSGTPDGDGLVVIADGNDPASATVFFLQGQKVLVAKPADYNSLRLQ
jgi:hypothetical protein